MTTSTENIRRASDRLAVRSEPAALLVLGGLMAGAALLYLWEGRGLLFYYDEWSFIVNRREWSLDAFLQPHNEHLSAVPVALYKLLFAVVGLDAYWPYRLAVVAAHVLVVGLVFLLARRAAGDLIGLAAAAVILFLGSGWEDILWPFQLGYLVSLAAGLGAILLLDRRDVVGDACAALLLAVSLSSASIGVPIALTMGILVASGSDRWRRLWIVLGPFALYGTWWLAYGRTHPEVGGDFQSNLPNLPTYIADAIAGALAGMTGLTAEWGRPLALVAVIALGFLLLRAHPFPMRAGAYLAGGLAFWALAGLTRGQLNVPGGSRYVYFGAIVAVLVAAELMRGVKLGTIGAALLIVGVAAAGLGNYRNLEGGVTHLAEYTGSVGSSLGALELAGPDVAADYRPDPVHAPDISAGKYFDAVEELGSPAFTPAEITRQAEPHRQAADAVLITALGLGPRPAGAVISAGPTPIVESVANAEVETDGSCLVLREANSSTVLHVTVAGEGLEVEPEDGAFVEVAVRRFAGEYGPAAGMTLPGGAVALSLPHLGLDQPWHARIATTGPVRVCGLAGA